MGDKKICFVLGALTQGGVVNVYSRVAHELQNAGLDVTILVLSKKKDCAHLFEGFKIYYLKLPRSIVWISLVRHFLLHRDYTVILSAVDYVNVYTLFAAKIACVHSKLIATVHSNVMVEMQETKNQMQRMVIRIAQIVYPFADKIVAVSQGVKESVVQLTKVSPDKVCVIYNPVNKKHFFETAPNRPHPWFNKDSIVLLGCGRLTAQKDFSLLLEGFSYALKKQKLLKLIILGDGEQRTYLENLALKLKIKDKVAFMSHVHNAEDYMYYADLFVLSSRWEGFGNVILEALAAGCNVVSIDCPSGPREILEDGKYGLLITERTAEALGEAIVQHLKNPIEKKNLIDHAKCFSSDRIAKQYREIF